MPLREPPQAAGSLAAIPAEPIRGRLLHRVWRLRAADGTLRPDPWWFASVPRDPADGGRFDLPAPMGTCYAATRPVGAVLEALQMHLTNLPRAELALRRRAEILAPADAPRAAKLTARAVAGTHGITATSWAGSDRALCQRWAAALRRDGWWAVYGGIAHDPSGRLRSVALFDHSGAHPPTTGGPWTCCTTTLDDDQRLLAGLARYGVTVRDPGVLAYRDAPE
jgi:hypothetical protein